MEYELYIDVFFLENFMMDHLLLLLVGRILKSSATPGRTALGALAGSALFCAAVAAPLPCPVIKFFVFHAGISTAMLRLALRVPWGRQMACALGILYGAGFLLGGILSSLSQYRAFVEVGSLFFALAVGSYYAASGILWLLSLAGRRARCRRTADLYWEGRHLQVPAVIDTGNALTDPVSGEPVSILERTAAEELFGGQLPEGLRFIPYRSVGKKDGVLPAVRLGRLCVSGEGEQWTEGPLVGISDEDLSSDGTYRMLLHPDL